MKCIMCNTGDLQEGTTTVTLEHDTAVSVFKGVPALVCDQCGEAYTDGETTANLFGIVEEDDRVEPRELFVHYLG